MNTRARFLHNRLLLAALAAALLGMLSTMPQLADAAGETSAVHVYQIHVSGMT